MVREYSAHFFLENVAWTVELRNFLVTHRKTKIRDRTKSKAATYHKISQKNSKISKNHKKVIKCNAVIKNYYFKLHSAFIHNELNLFLFAMCCIVG